MATSQGTWAYRDRFGDAFARTYFRRFGPGVASSVGIGTYLGDPTATVDEGYRAAITEALESGVNLVDTAVNYRCGRSERVVGEALDAADVDRESVVVATKGGFLPFDGERPADPAAYVREEFLQPGLLAPEDLARGSHAITPGFLDQMLDRSLSALGVETVDCYYVHNPETQLQTRSREAVYDQLESAFETLERRRAAGDVGIYGVATWDAFRVPRDHDAYLSLPEVVDRAAAAAESVGADDPGLGAIQLPFNVRMADAYTVDAHRHPTEERDVSALEYAQAAGLDVVASATLAQGELAAGIPPGVDAELRGETAAQRAINFARSAPGVTAALVGTSSPAHVPENVAAGTFEPLGARAFDAVFE
ncbi:aldo/keto reductase [Halobellus ordinarius]|uniref:aldo/keto reductase n=1 Tax=Halobellus ordinarius TaxID=3075120 RepID=UPI002880832F|nr:aldo/keto reductase [Halobellus sp. ZY16]